MGILIYISDMITVLAHSISPLGCSRVIMISPFFPFLFGVIRIYVVIIYLLSRLLV